MDSRDWTTYFLKLEDVNIYLPEHFEFLYFIYEIIMCIRHLVD